MRRLVELVEEFFAVGAIPLGILLVHLAISRAGAETHWNTPHDSRTCAQCQEAQRVASATGLPVRITLH